MQMRTGIFAQLALCQRHKVPIVAQRENKIKKTSWLIRPEITLCNLRYFTKMDKSVLYVSEASLSRYWKHAGVVASGMLKLQFCSQDVSVSSYCNRL